MNGIKRRPREIIGFLLGLLLLLMVGSRIAQRTAILVRGTSILKRNTVAAELKAEPANTIDVVTIGDSESYTTVSTMQVWMDLGIPVYNAGQSGQNMNELNHMFRTVLETQKPKVILMETHALFRTSKSFDGLQELIAERVAARFPIFQYHDLWKYAILKTKQNNGNYKGFQVRIGVNPYTGEKQYMSNTKKKAEIPWMNLMVFDEVLKECQDRGIKLILYSAPSPHNYWKKRHNALEALAKEKQLIYLDMNMKTDEIGIDWNTDTQDSGDHLNISGAQKTTSYLEGLLAKLNLTDRRKDPTYKRWNELSEEYVQLAEAHISNIRKSG